MWPMSPGSGTKDLLCWQFDIPHEIRIYVIFEKCLGLRHLWLYGLLYKTVLHGYNDALLWRRAQFSAILHCSCLPVWYILQACISLNLANAMHYNAIEGLKRSDLFYAWPMCNLFASNCKCSLQVECWHEYLSYDAYHQKASANCGVHL